MNKVVSKGAVTSGALYALTTGVSTDGSNIMDWVDKIFESLLSTPGNLQDLIVKGLNWLIGASAILCVVMLIVAGFMYMTSGGNEDKTQKATKTLTNAIVGLVICFVAVMLVNFVLKTFLSQS